MTTPTIREIAELAARKITTYVPTSHDDMNRRFADFVEEAIREAAKPLVDGLGPFAAAANYNQLKRAREYKVKADHCRRALELRASFTGIQGG